MSQRQKFKTPPRFTSFMLILLSLLVVALALPSLSAQNWQIYNRANSNLASDRVFTMTVDPSQTVWVGYDDINYASGPAGLPLSHLEPGGWMHEYEDVNGLALVVNDFLEKGNGDKWMATGNGLQKWDASGFTYFNPPLLTNNVVALDSDAVGNIWAGGPGLSVFDGTNWTQYLTANSGIPGDVVKTLDVDAAGNTWVGTTAGMAKLNGTTWTTYTAVNSPLTNNNIGRTISDGSGGVWCYSNNELAHLTSTGTWSLYTTANSGLPNQYLRDIVLDASGNLWAAGLTGLVKFDGTNWTVYNTSNSGIASNTIFQLQFIGTDLFLYAANSLQKFDGTTFTTYAGHTAGTPQTFAEDHAGNLWSSHSQKGLQRLSGTTFTRYTHETTSTHQAPTYSIAADASGAIWNGNSYGLHKLDGGTWTTFKPSNSGMSEANISEVHPDGSGGVWILGTLGTGVSHFDGTTTVNYITGSSGIPSSFVYAMDVDPAGNLWLATFAGLAKFDGTNWTIYTTANSNLASDNIENLRVDDQGDVYVGTVASGGAVTIQRFNGSTWTNYPVIPNAYMVVDVDHGAQTGLWVGTGSGAYEYNGTGWNQYTMSNSPMPTDSILFLQHDSIGNIWMGHTSGLSKYGPTQLVQLPNDTVICPPDSVFLDIGAAFNSILWSTGDTTSSIYVTTGGSYFVTATDGFGTTSSDTIFLTVGSGTAPVVNLGNDTTICQLGPYLTLDAGSHPNATYLWNTNETSSSINVNSSGQYTVYVLDNCGNVGYDTIQVTFSQAQVAILDSSIVPHPVLPSDTLFCEDTLVTTTNPSQLGGNWSLLWSTGSTQNGIEITQSGTYSVIFTDQYGCQAFDTIHVTVDTSCVYPGDANNDGVANNVDVLGVGVGFGNIGASRQAPYNDNLWYGHPVADWSTTYANGMNFKHADCDGSGLVNQPDVNVISLNYGQTHNKTNDVAGGVNDPALYFYNLEDSVMAGDTLHIIVGLGRDTLTADSVYGIAFTLFYDMDLVDTNSVVVSYDSSWLGTSGVDLIHLDKDFYFDGKVEVGMCRSNHLNRNGYGRIATISVVVQDDVAGKDVITENMDLSYADVTMIAADETVLPVNLDTGDVVVFQTIESRATDALAGLSVYPNPAQDRVLVFGPGVQTENIGLMDVWGRRLREWMPVQGPKQVLDLTGIAPGVYFLRISDGEQQTTRKLVIAR